MFVTRRGTSWPACQIQGQDVIAHSMWTHLDKHMWTRVSSVYTEKKKQMVSSDTAACLPILAPLLFH